MFSSLKKKVLPRRGIFASEELYSIFLNGVNDGIFDWNLEDDTIFYASSYHTILGYTEGELGVTHDQWRAIIHPDDQAAAIETTRRYAEREIPTYHNIFRARHRDGRWVWVQSRAVGIWNDQGKLSRLVGIHTDITLQKQHEEALRQFAEENQRQKEELEIAKERAEAASRAKSDFLATMSHEIRTPLNVVIGVSRLLVEQAKTQTDRDMVEALYANADLLSKLVSDLLDLSRIERTSIELETQPFVLNDILKAISLMFEKDAANKGLTFSVKDNTESCVLVGDPFRLQQILVNLVGNALKFTAHGSIAVSAESDIRDDKAKVRITIADTGVGIPSEKLAVIFDKFVQGDQTISRRFGGSGLGLAICKSLVEVMGGKITLSSELGKGSTFTVDLAFGIGKHIERTPTESPIATPTPVARGTALVVEDYPANTLVATLLLEKLGYKVEAAASGFEALDKVQARNAPYDVILMDVHMPDMDGFEATQRLRDMEKQKGFRHHIVGVTAHAMAGDRDRCIEAGMDEYVTKPINAYTLAQKIEMVAKS